MRFLCHLNYQRVTYPTVSHYEHEVIYVSELEVAVPLAGIIDHSPLCTLDDNASEPPVTCNLELSQYGESIAASEAYCCVPSSYYVTTFTSPRQLLFMSSFTSLKTLKAFS